MNAVASLLVLARIHTHRQIGRACIPNNTKMSQEIKTPSVVNLHNELGARFPFFMTFV